jgi:hypothetical protein
LLSDFIIAHCDGDLSVLVVSGNPSDEELQSIWSGLYQQYIKAIGGSSLNARSKDVIEYLRLQGRARVAEMIFQWAPIEKAKGMVVEWLNLSPYNLINATVENIDTVLEQLEGLVKFEFLKLESVSKKLEKVNIEDVKPSEDNYYDTIAGIAEILGPTINVNDTNVAQYCSYVKQYQKRVQAQIRQNNKK